MKMTSMVIGFLSLMSTLSYAGDIQLNGKEASDLMLSLKLAGAQTTSSRLFDRKLALLHLNCSSELSIKKCDFTQVTFGPPPTQYLITHHYSVQNEAAERILQDLAQAGVKPQPNPEKLSYSVSNVKCEKTNKRHIDFFDVECSFDSNE